MKNANDTEYLSIEKSDNPGICRATIGRNRGNDKYIMFDPDICSDRSIYHEMFHVLGLLHEHQRKDRDQYVTIQWANIPHGHNKQFVKYPRITKTLSMPYDGTSIMHYYSTQGNAFAGESTIVSNVCTI